MTSEVATQVSVAVVVAWQVAGQLCERHFIDAALELHHDIQRYPIVMPAPSIKLRMAGGAESELPVVRNQPQQIPDLLLSLVVTSGIAPYESVRHFVTQPVPCAGNDAHVFRHQPHFFVQLSVHRLLWRFAPVDATLWKLPRVGADAFAPEHLVSLVEQNDADIGPEAFSVKHNQSQIYILSGLCIGLRWLRSDCPPVGKQSRGKSQCLLRRCGLAPADGIHFILLLPSVCRCHGLLAS